ncbi:hypothetical protein WJX73_000109 [Symbiochloris irregularis]|uniref:Uncharacterized protein n=1 Tax=Symbiochloris irregularis TaxID=706552 RepID=A0AAW1PDI5_9CHLO
MLLWMHAYRQQQSEQGVHVPAPAASADDRAAAGAPPVRTLRTGRLADVIRATLVSQAPPPAIPSIVPKRFLETNRKAIRAIRETSEVLSRHGPMRMAPSSSGTSSFAPSLLTPAAGRASGHSMRGDSCLLAGRH